MTKWLNTIDEAIDDLWSYRPFALMGAHMTSVPALNLVEKDDQYLASLSIPGIDAKKVKVKVSDRTLSISYSDKLANEEKDAQGKILKQEYSTQSFSRLITLPPDADTKSIKATSKHGVLELHISKLKDLAQGREIPINIE